MLNALVAMPNGGELMLEAGKSEEGKAQVLVKDTGTGIREELQGRIFDSFLTGTTDGTGLGLSISKRILKAHDGDLDLLESGNNGTVFKITLPMSS
jgi:signal transduction histidine kinase